MYIELHDGFKRVQKIPATRIVVYDDFDNPIAAVIRITNGQYVAVTAAQKQFLNILKAMGITQSLVIEHIDPKKIPVLT